LALLDPYYYRGSCHHKQGYKPNAYGSVEEQDERQDAEAPVERGLFSLNMKVVRTNVDGHM